jgi:hypothetical protein
MTEKDPVYKPPRKPAPKPMYVDKPEVIKRRHEEMDKLR